ncbi:MAG: hypothetical protein HUU35_03885, partial [Armatimonadetes bacterium]|nr:hypothetical protein [Armatimonadota bacterium]
MKREATVRILDEKTDTVIKVWKDLLERYRELEQVGEWATSRPRVVVLGEAETRPDEVFAALFGEPVATARHDRAEQPPWEVYATFGVDNLPGGGVVGAEGSE